MKITFNTILLFNKKCSLVLCDVGRESNRGEETSKFRRCQEATRGNSFEFRRIQKEIISHFTSNRRRMKKMKKNSQPTNIKDQIYNLIASNNLISSDKEKWRWWITTIWILIIWDHQGSSSENGGTLYLTILTRKGKWRYCCTLIAWWLTRKVVL